MRWLLATCATLLLLGGLWLVGELIPHAPEWEVSVMTWMADHRTSLADDVMSVITAFGSPAFTFIVLGIGAALALVWMRSPLWFAFFLLCMAAPALYDRFLKQLVERPRPDFSRVVEVSGFGFPSGHATSACHRRRRSPGAGGRRRIEEGAPLRVGRSHLVRATRRREPRVPGGSLADRRSRRVRPRRWMGDDLCFRSGYPAIISATAVPATMNPTSCPRPILSPRNALASPAVAAG